MQMAFNPTLGVKRGLWRFAAANIHDLWATRVKMAAWRRGRWPNRPDHHRSGCNLQAYSGAKGSQVNLGIADLVRGRGCGTEATVRAGRCVPGLAVALPAAIILAALWVQYWPAAQKALEFDRHAVAAGQWWRVLTCHLTHWSWYHLVWDVGTFAAWCWLVQRKHRMLMLLSAAFAVVGLAVHAGGSDIAIYRGISGINYALQGCVLAALVAQTRRFLRLGCLGLLLAVAGKITCQLVMPDRFPGMSLPEGTVVVGVAHAAGLIVGVIAGSSKPRT